MGGQSNATVLRVGICRNRNLKFTCMFQRVLVKLSTKFRIFPVAGDCRYLEIDPSQFRDKYTVVQEYVTSEPGRPT